jgi:mannose-6-phosphate isomerase-like protein (cupin superfamily)
MEKPVKVIELATAFGRMKPVENYPPGRSNTDLVDEAMSENMLIVYQRFAPGHMGSYHLHHKCENVFVVLKGTFVAIIGGKRYVVPAGQMIFMPNEVPHAMGCLGDEEVLGLEIYSPPRGVGSEMDSFKVDLPDEIIDADMEEAMSIS